MGSAQSTGPIPLSQVLRLIGRLDDASGEESGRERFRRYLADTLSEAGALRDYVEECLRASGEQQNKALQDLINRTGELLGFHVRYGRYRGVQGEIGFDGLWVSPTGARLVVEVKTTEAYAISISTLLNYINRLREEGEIPAEAEVLGLYVVGRQDKEVAHLENTILAQKKTDVLRVISADSLLALAEILGGYEVEHEDILAVLGPSRPSVDFVVDILKRVVGASPPWDGSDETPDPVGTSDREPDATGVKHWLTPVGHDTDETAEDIVERLVLGNHLFAFGHRAAQRAKFKPGDRVCFYAAGVGVTAEGRITQPPERASTPVIRDSDSYPYVFTLDDVRRLDVPQAVDAEARSQLDVFKGRDLSRAWGWFVMTTRQVSEHDYSVLTGMG